MSYTTNDNVTCRFIHVLVVYYVSNNRRREGQVLILACVRAFSTKGTMAPICLRVFFNEIRFVLGSPDIFINEFNTINGARGIRPIRFRRVNYRNLRIRSTKGTSARISTACRFFKSSISHYTTSVATTAYIRNFISACKLCSIHSRGIRESVLVFEIFKEGKRTIRNNYVVTITRSTSGSILRSILFECS